MYYDVTTILCHVVVCGIDVHIIVLLYLCQFDLTRIITFQHELTKKSD